MVAEIFYEHPEFSRIPVSMSISNNELNVYAETDLLNENIHYGAGVHQFLVSSENKGNCGLDDYSSSDIKK